MPPAIKPFPTDPEKRRLCAAAMQSTSPDLMAEIAALRKQFPGARLTRFTCSAFERGEPIRDGWEVDENLSRKVRWDRDVADKKAKKK